MDLDQSLSLFGVISINLNICLKNNTSSNVPRGSNITGEFDMPEKPPPF